MREPETAETLCFTALSVRQSNLTTRGWSHAEWAQSIPAGGTVFIGFNRDQGAALGTTGLLDSVGLFDGGWIGD